MRSFVLLRASGALLLLVAAAVAQLPEDDPGDFVRQGKILAQKGQQQEAQEMYRRALQLGPDSWQANDAMGVSLDLSGNYAEARKHFTRAIHSATGPNKIRALRDMAISYAFESNCGEAEVHAQQAYDLALAAKDFYTAGEVANELGRICIEAGDLDKAQKWYRTGYETGLKQPDIKPDRRNLWAFRWEHAQARIAARRGNKEQAERHVGAAQQVLAAGDNAEQQQFMPYLAGYVEFYLGDYKLALDHLLKGNQNDPFILSMIARTYEKLGDRAKALDYFSRSLASQAHNPAVAFSRPLALRKLAAERRQVG
jgi:tetratricopeptide (TPR) repeat protein